MTHCTKAAKDREYKSVRLASPSSSATTEFSGVEPSSTAIENLVIRRGHIHVPTSENVLGRR